MINNGNTCKHSFNMRHHVKLFGTYDNCHTTINTKPVNFIWNWNRMEDRGSVVPNARHYGKGAKSIHDHDNCSGQGVAYSDQRLDVTVSSNDEQAYPDSTSNILNKLNRMGNINNHPINNLLKKMRSFDLWITAYAKLTRNPASLTRGTDSNTIDGTSIETLKALQAKVLTGSYPWGSIRRIWIPKPGRAEKRPLEIPNFQDRIVQEVIRMLLETIYEKKFLDSSHGFRANRGQHSCIKYIRAWFPGTAWYIEGDINKFYDSIDHDILVTLLRKRIKDKKFLGLIESGLKSKVIDCKVIFKTELGTPQGSVVSPLLSNIYLHELDRYMNRIMRIINHGKRRRANPEYHRLCQKAYRARLDFKTASNATKQARQLQSKDPMDDQYRRVQYVRYADDFLVGVIGSKKLALRLKESIKTFLKTRLKLQLNEEKTHITHHDQRIPWLGFLISTANKPKVAKARLRNRTILQRIPPLSVKVYTDIKKVINRLSEKGYCDRAGTSIPNWKEALQPPQSYSVERGARLIRGLDAYYKVADDRRATTHRVMYIIRNSLAKTFAAKFKLDTINKVLAKAGKDLSRPLKSKRSVIGNTDERQAMDAAKAGGKLITRTVRIPFTLAKEIPKPDTSHSFSGRAPGSKRDPFVVLRGKAERAHTALKGVCCVCGSNQNVEMHHIRGIKELKGRTISERIMIAINRKQIPLCRSCHLKAHGKKVLNKLN
jgi:group II intron reverse transcriptase/maturase